MTPEDTKERKKELARRKRERIIIAVTMVLVVVVTYLETQVVRLTGDQPLASSILVFALININALLLLLLIFLIFRNLVKLMMERRRGVLGSKLRTRLVMAFVLLSLAPTILLFFAAYQFVGTSIEFWFSAQVERSLYDALETSSAYNEKFSQNLEHFAETMVREIKADRKVSLKRPGKELDRLVEERRALYDLAAARVFTADMKDLAYVTQSGTHRNHLQSFHLDLVSRALKSGTSQNTLQAAPTGDFAVAVAPIIAQKGARPEGAVAVFRLLPKNALARAADIRQGLEGYRQLKGFKNPIKTNQYITLSIVTLLIVFTATWFGFYLAKTITVPIMELAQGTQRIAGGDYDFFINQEGPDEMGTLVNAFNRMTADLKTSKARLDEAQQEMQRTNRELDGRRRHMEVILKNVAAGVVAVDAQGRITTFNPSAERMLKVQSEVAMGKNWQDILQGGARETLERLVSGTLPGLAGSASSKQVRVNIGGDTLTLMLHMGALRDETGRTTGMVVVFEDLTDIEKAQRMQAWREVARRIAHEVKNPLTPIKLSAQRLMRRYGEKVQGDEAVFNECTTTIIRQVEELQALVNEFSTFARLPSSRLGTNDITKICREALNLFVSAHGDISFDLECEDEIPPFDLDREQISRVLINLLDNAAAAVRQTEPPHQIAVRLSFDDILKIVRLEVEDSGPGVPSQDKLRLFEPYFSTKKGGTGLGLAIVSTIVADHNGFIRVQDNQPRGTRIIIELPARGMEPGHTERA